MTVGGEDAAGGGAGADGGVDAEGDVEFGGRAGDGGGEEAGEFGAEDVEDGGGEAPHVHGDGFVAGEWAWGRVRGAVFCAGGSAVDVGEFFDGGEETAGVDGAETAGDAAVFAEGIAEREADHAPWGGVLVGWQGAEEGTHGGEGGGAVVVVGVDDAERFVDGVAGGPDGVAGAPWFLAGVRGGEACGEVVEVLEDEIDGEVGFETADDAVAEFGFAFAADDEDDAGEASGEGVEDGVVEEGFAGGAHAVGLFGFAAIAGGHAGGEDEEGGGWREGGHEGRAGVLEIAAQTGFEGGDAEADVFVGFHAFFDGAAGVHDGAVVAAAEGFADFVVGEAGHFAGEVHGGLASEGDGGGAFAADHVGEADVEFLGGEFLDFVDADAVFSFLAEEVAEEVFGLADGEGPVEGDP